MMDATVAIKSYVSNPCSAKETMSSKKARKAATPKVFVHRCPSRDALLLSDCRPPRTGKSHASQPTLGDRGEPGAALIQASGSHSPRRGTRRHQSASRSCRQLVNHSFGLGHPIASTNASPQVAATRCSIRFSKAAVRHEATFEGATGEGPTPCDLDGRVAQGD